MNINYTLITEVLFIIYGLALLFLISYGLIQIHLVYNYVSLRKTKDDHRHRFLQHPFITVQLPVYNEPLVIERLINAVAAFNYPKDRFEVQVLDDSTDDTSSIVAANVRLAKTKGVNIFHIQRTNRKGYKAGALQEGLLTAKGEFIALFDADFIPPKDFLQKVITYFEDNSVGMVQTRWSHINKDYCLLTHFQAFLLDAHFSIEQMGRSNAGYFINFSGTGGVWRRACIDDAGGWNADTLTEDFDLSYRAQLKGWKFKYIEDISVPAELPPVMSALKKQQYRWIKGNAETAKKHLKNVLHSSLSPIAKVHAFFHLTVGMVFICAFLASVLSIPLLMLKPHVPALKAWFQYASFSLLSLVCLSVFHYVSTVHSHANKNKVSAKYFFKTFPLYLSFTMGISLNNALAVAEAILGIKSTFVRTPKFNIAASVKQKVENKEHIKDPLFFFELLLMVYFLTGIILAFYYKDFSMLPYHLMLAFGFGMICFFTLKERLSLAV